jgi:hypothetical protein
VLRVIVLLAYVHQRIAIFSMQKRNGIQGCELMCFFTKAHHFFDLVGVFFLTKTDHFFDLVGVFFNKNASFLLTG